MDYRNVFAISAAGMDLERQRVDVATLNLANANTVQAPNGRGYVPMRVVARSLAALPGGFQNLVISGGAGMNAAGATVTVEPLDVAARQSYDPGHPYADEHGFVRYAPVDTATEMMTMMSAIRAYEANVAAMNTSRQMAVKALEIGGGS
jgi:flagellar basal-body rod protein FlgC